MTTTKLPVVIAGAGPCGLVAAITLQQEGIPFVLVERATRQKLCRNVGSGFDLCPTTIDILKRLNIPEMSMGFHKYGGMYMCDMDGNSLRESAMTAISEDYEAISANRAAMQECFLNYLLQNEREKKDDFDESTILKCGVEVTSFDDDNEESNSVTVHLSDGSSIDGSALLGCDGIHSNVRQWLMSSLPKPVEDELHFCNVICWWGKTEMKPGTDFSKALEATQKHKADGSSFIWALGDGRHPGSFMGAPSGNTFMWAFLVQSSEEPKKKSDDLTRRGGVTLNDEDKNLLEFIVKDRGDLIRLAVKETPSSGITKVGLFDRKNLNLPYSKGRVALLGDAAHPQSPMMGQGCNQAITDAYVCAMRLSKQPLSDALEAYDSKARRKGVNTVIKKARSYGNMACSHNRVICWMFSIFASRMPLSWLWSDMIEADMPNHDFVKELDKDLGAI